MEVIGGIDNVFRRLVDKGLFSVSSRRKGGEEIEIVIKDNSK